MSGYAGQGSIRRVALIGNHPPRICGIATFTADVETALAERYPGLAIDVYAMNDPAGDHVYPPTVVCTIAQDEVGQYLAAARRINESGADIVCVQHEYGIFGGAAGSRLIALLDRVSIPVIATLHTVLERPSADERRVMEALLRRASKVIVMAEKGREILKRVHGADDRKIVMIPHGVPDRPFADAEGFKPRFGWQGREVILTFGLLAPSKGIETMIEAMPAVAARHPEALYLIAGQTHPELLKQRGEEYRNRLQELVDGLDLGDHVLFVNQYLDQKDIIDYLLATDVYVTPYLDPNQITSGTLSYALGAGKAVVSTPYLHATEALAKDRGMLVDFRSAEGIADAVNAILDDPKLKARLEKKAYTYANQATWPKTGARFLAAMQELVDEHPVAPTRKRQEKPLHIATRVASNPLIVPSDVEPSQPGFEVIGTINPGIATLGDETISLVRVVERPRHDVQLDGDAQMIDLSGPRPRLTPLPHGLTAEHLIGMAYFDYEGDPPRVVIGYVPRDLPGLDLSDPRTIRYRNTQGGFAPGQVEFTDYLSHISHLRVARSSDGAHFTFDDMRIEAAEPIEAYGVEDARITEIDGLFHITYVAVSRLGITTARMSTTDFRTFERHGTMLQPDQKDVVLFPEKVNGRYLAFTRPMPGSFGRVLGLWLTESDDLMHWGGHRPVAEPRHGMWDEMRIGASCVPIRTEGGWLELYHGADRMNRYGMGAMLLDADDPTKVLARTARPILEAEEKYEHDGFLQDVVFPSGHIDLGGGRIRVFYGAADEYVCAADLAIDDVLSALTPV